MDIEKAEYDVIPHMVEMNAMLCIDVLYLEDHHSMSSFVLL